MALDLHKWIDEKIAEAIKAESHNQGRVSALLELHDLLKEALINEQKNLAPMGTGDAGGDQSVGQVDFCLTHPECLMPCQYCSGTGDPEAPL